MLELQMVDGKTVYIPLAKVYEISQSGNGLVAAVTGSDGKVVWHNIRAFSILREGQRMAL